MTITIHRGTHQIGGCVTEISAGCSRVFVDIGENLPGTTAKLHPIEGLTTGNGANSALFITHYHGDHIGCLESVLSEIPIYMGATARSIQMNYVERISPNKLPRFENIKTYEPFEPVVHGDITVTPLKSDHSAADSYMFLIEADGCRILHTGDFRLHGIWGRKLLKTLSQCSGIDYIICEGTNLSRSGEPPVSEYDLRRKAREMMAEKPYVFVLCGSTNIDRIGTFYHANPKGRLFVCDKYQKKQLEAVRESQARSRSFYDFQHVYDYAPNLDKLMTEKGFCMIVRQGEYFKRIMEKFSTEYLTIETEHRMGGRADVTSHREGCLVIYSMWTGYLHKRAKNQKLVDFLAPYRYRVLHTSGHASSGDLKRLYDVVKPKRGLIPIHSDEPEKFREIIPNGNIFSLDDGEKWEIT